MTIATSIYSAFAINKHVLPCRNCMQFWFNKEVYHYCIIRNCNIWNTTYFLVDHTAVVPNCKLIGNPKVDFILVNESNIDVLGVYRHILWQRMPKPDMFSNFKNSIRSRLCAKDKWRVIVIFGEGIKWYCNALTL